MKKEAFGVISLLIGLVIVSVLFIIMINAMKGLGGKGLGQSSVNTKNIEQEIDSQINEIQNMRQQSIELNNKIQQQDNY